MPFSPDTEIRIYKGTKVSKTDQPFFTSEQAKMDWYGGHNPLLFRAQSYQREKRQYARINVSASLIRGYDMMAYRNAATDKWILCNITGTEFVNPNTTDVFFEVDPMQTWIESIEWRQCWVEREMVQNDWNGSLPNWNTTVVEGIASSSPYVDILYDATPQITGGGWSVHVLSAYDANAEENYNIVAIGDYLSGVNDIILDPNTAALPTLLKKYATEGRLEGIIGIWIYPTKYSYLSPSAEFFSVPFPTAIAGYVPKNAKCFSSEFCKVEIVNRMGDSIELAPEYVGTLGSGVMQFMIEGVFANGGGGIRCAPVDYMGVHWSLQSNANVDYGVVLPANIQCAYVGDNFANWLAQNKVGIGIGLVQDIGKAVVGTVATGGVGGAIGGISATAGTISDIAAKMTTPAGVYGQSSSLALFPATKTFGFRVNFKSPGPETIKTIDDFFSVYGYKVCRMKAPNVNTRPYWNYVKCAPAIVGGPMNSKDRETIEGMLNNGVTFWNVTNGAVIGDYSSDNRG